MEYLKYFFPIKSTTQEPRLKAIEKVGQVRSLNTAWLIGRFHDNWVSWLENERSIISAVSDCVDVKSSDFCLSSSCPLSGLRENCTYLVWSNVKGAKLDKTLEWKGYLRRAGNSGSEEPCPIHPSDAFGCCISAFERKSSARLLRGAYLIEKLVEGFLMWSKWKHQVSCTTTELVLNLATMPFHFRMVRSHNCLTWLGIMRTPTTSIGTSKCYLQVGNGWRSGAI